jgi:NADH/NAD ratio-sensing transcriptional regulator Rex
MILFNSSLFSEDNMSKIVVIGKGEFGHSLVQGLKSAVITTSNTTATVEHVSATEFFSIGPNQAGQMLANASFVMHAGKKLSECSAYGSCS